MNYTMIKTKSAGYAIQCNKTNRIVCHGLTEMQAIKILQKMNKVTTFAKKDEV